MLKCPECGTEIAKARNFCPKCGAKIEMPATLNGKNSQICPNCKKEIPKNVLYCKYCGTRVAVSSNVNKASPERGSKIDGLHPFSVNSPPSNSHLAVPGIQSFPITNKSSNGLKVFGLIVLAIFCLIGLIIGGYWVQSWMEERKELERERQAELARRAKENRFNKAISLNNPNLICPELYSDAQKACAALVAIAGRGRSQQSERTAIRDFLEKQGYKKIGGYVVAQLEPGFYECAYLQYDYYYGYFPSSARFVLKTTLTEYYTTGIFTIWAKRYNSKIPVTLKNGSIRNWNFYEEDALGTSVEGIFSAPAGVPTQEAAKLVLRAMLGI